jgi:hypothetical protein
MGPDLLYSFSDTLYKTAVTAATPAANAEPQTNPVSGKAQDVAFTWARLGSTTASNGYQLEIALDSAFNQTIFRANAAYGTVAAAGTLGTATLLDPVVCVVGPDQPAGNNYSFAPGTTYYWRVRTVTPLESLWSATRSFTFTSLDKPFALTQPAIGATDVAIKPILSWTAYKGAKWYEVTVSEDPSFAIPEWSHNVGAGVVPPTTVYGVVDALKYGTTYYWKVRGVTADPFVQGTAVITPAGPYQFGAFTTMAEPIITQPAVITIEKPAPPAQVQVVQIPVEKIVQQSIPNWMLMTIIVIGAVLVIALIVLIVRTRRVA